MSEQILVTGGAGFIGSYPVDALRWTHRTGHWVRVLDNLEPQVHDGLCERSVVPFDQNRMAVFILPTASENEMLEFLKWTT